MVALVGNWSGIRVASGTASQLADSAVPHRAGDYGSCADRQGVMDLIAGGTVNADSGLVVCRVAGVVCVVPLGLLLRRPLLRSARP